MIKKISLTLALGTSIILLQGQNGSKPILLDDVVSGKFHARGAGYGMRSLPDGAHYSMMNSARNAIIRYSFATGQAVDTLFSINNARECSFNTFDDYQIAPGGKHILLYTNQKPIYRRSSKATVHHFDVRRRLVAPLSDKGGEIMIPTFSPDGRMVAFVRDNNIFIKKFDFNTEVQVTEDGRYNYIINGTTDWVYEEELEATNLMSWSEDGAFLSWVKTNESKVLEYRMPMYMNALYPRDYSYKYPKAGEDNSKVSVHIYNVSDRSQKKVNIPESDAYYIPKITYIGKEQTLSVVTLNRHQNHLKVIYVNSKTLVPKTIFEEKNSRYINSEKIHSITFTPEGFLYHSDRTGYGHLYHYGHQGQLLRTITSGKYDVTQLYGIDSKGNIYCQAADKSPLERNVYLIDKQGKQVSLNTPGGTHDAVFSDGFQYYISSHSTLNTPTQTAIYRTGVSKPIRVLEDNKALAGKLLEHRFAPKEVTSITLSDGTVLNGWMVKPQSFTPDKKYPVLMIQYSGPGSQMVLDRYGFGWEYALAEKGIIVVAFDGRGTGARGEEWQKMTYLRLGVRESDDQIAVAKALGKLPYIDADRIGIWGWSFGGYNSLMCLSRGDGVFKLGIAVAPVVDWRYYDTIYTERFMRTPKENPEGYRASSVLEHAHKIKGKLLVIHGSADDNVHLQNTMDLTALLVEKNIPFDMAIYTDKDHSIRGGNTSRHLYTKMMNYILTHL